MDLLSYYFMHRLFTVSDSGLFAVYLRLTFGLLGNIILDSPIGECGRDIIILSFHVNPFYYFRSRTIYDIA